MKLSLIAYDPIIQASRLYARDFADDLTENHEGYSHTISAVGGFDSAAFPRGYGEENDNCPKVADHAESYPSGKSEKRC